MRPALYVPPILLVALPMIAAPQARHQHTPLASPASPSPTPSPSVSPSGVSASHSAPLAERLRSTDPEVRGHAVLDLGHSPVAEPEAGTALARLTELAADPVAGVRENVAEALGHFRGGRPDAVPTLSRLLRDPEPRVRIQGARSLAEIGPAAAQAVPALLELLRDPDVNLAREAARALGKIGGTSFDPAVAALADVLKTSKDLGLREEAAHALGEASHSPAALAALTEALSDTNPAVRREVLHALGRMPASHADHVLPALKFALDDKDDAVGAAAAQAAGRFGAAGIPVLVRALQNPGWIVRWWAAVQLGTLGELAAPAVENLRRALQDEQVTVREAAANALSRIEGSRPSPLPSPSVRPSPSASPPA